MLTSRPVRMFLLPVLVTASGLLGPAATAQQGPVEPLPQWDEPTAAPTERTADEIPAQNVRGGEVSTESEVEHPAQDSEEGQAQGPPEHAPPFDQGGGREMPSEPDQEVGDEANPLSDGLEEDPLQEKTQ